MSTHCSRYPSCGCSPDCGTKCDLPNGHPRLLDKEEGRNNMGYPLLENGEIDWEKTAEEKSRVRDFYERVTQGENHQKKPKRKGRPTNYTPPKKRRK